MSDSAGRARGPAHPLPPRWIVRIALTTMVICFIPALRDSFDLETILWMVGTFVVAEAVLFADDRLTRPRRSFFRWGAASVITAMVFVLVPDTPEGRFPLLGAIAWAGVSVLGLIWTVYYERSEPL